MTNADISVAHPCAQVVMLAVGGTASFFCTAIVQMELGHPGTQAPWIRVPGDEAPSPLSGLLFGPSAGRRVRAQRFAHPRGVAPLAIRLAAPSSTRH